MTELITAINGKSENRATNVWEYIIFVLLPIVVTFAISIYVFDMFPEGSEYFAREDVANETFKSYSQKLNAISEKYAKELVIMEKVN
ncbi:MAG: hypothetical protein WBM69_13695 [Desulfobacterales bacterium]